MKDNEELPGHLRQVAAVFDAGACRCDEGCPCRQADRPSPAAQVVIWAITLAVVALLAACVAGAWKVIV